MAQPNQLANKPLSDEEFERLAALLDEHSPFDYDGLLGLLHAIALAPGLVAPSTWLPVVLPDGIGDADKATAERSIGLVFRQYNEVVDALANGQAMLPEEDDFEACESFAAGYAAGAELDPEWRNDADRWSFASGMAYLGGRLDLVSEAEVREIEENLAPAPKEILSRNLSAAVRVAYDTFKQERVASSTSAAQGAVRAVKTGVGRNDPCPCGSGKKYKRCCIGQG